MKQKWIQLETFPKSILVSFIFTLIMILIGSILLIVDTSYLYGVLVGAVLLYISYFIIWVLWYAIPPIKTSMAKLTPLLAPMIRTAIFVIAFLLILFLVNDGEGLEKVLSPINTLMSLITYTLTLFSYGVVILVDSILENKNK